MAEQGGAFRNSTSPKTTRRKPVHVAQLRGVGVTSLSVANTGNKTLRDGWQPEKIQQKSRYCQQCCPPATCTPCLNHLKILLYRSLMKTRASRALRPAELIQVWHQARTPLPVEIPSMLDNQKHFPPICPLPQQHFSSDSGRGWRLVHRKTNQRSRKLFPSGLHLPFDLHARAFRIQLTSNAELKVSKN